MNQHLEKVKWFYGKRQRLPTFTEMQRLFNFHNGMAVSWLVYNWIKDGFLKEENYQIVPTTKFFELPLLGTIKAGVPTVEPEWYDTISDSVVSPEKIGYKFALYVSGDSMSKANIKSGDIAVIDAKRTPKNGDIVAAYVDNEWTLKYLRKDKQGTWLEAANPKYAPIYPKKSLKIAGVLDHIVK